ncbi:phosphoglucosamine mutase [Prosthecochloris sp. GSB1]|uniref:phosphoglucosamine mutase n=1 Tax=Prosthecochloris sp. GSB1 TaxID=281093 RepID=UPI000B8C9678|nr:phosphoglucosamine mutase [Prosthecochloris sp. GSB1]ASQ91578.1 phosphoglucosamine mutase [Prosthecochloris sp. GSB1]
MSLMISVSGIRGIVGNSLTPDVLTSFAQAFATWLRSEKSSTAERYPDAQPKIVIGRDTRPTGEVIAGIVGSTLALCGCRVVDIGVATTPTVEIATVKERADGGIIVTASHNPVEWNALKLLDSEGEFLNESELGELLRILDRRRFTLADWSHTGTVEKKKGYDDAHIRDILNLSCIYPEKIAACRYSVLVDAVEGAGSTVMPELCRRLGVGRVETISCEGSGIFPRNPEPIAAHLTATVDALRKTGCDFAIVVDPDVDRIALVCEDGSLFGEEYSLVACADYYLKHRPGPVVNNLSSSRALRDVAGKYGQECLSAKVGEANVIDLMKACGAVIGGEGNGGIILPELHFGRDALVGAALLIQAFTDWRERNSGNSALSGFRKSFPSYFMAKQKESFDGNREKLQSLFDDIAERHPDAKATMTDGMKLDFADEWVHVRPSNTEPVLRIYAEAGSVERAKSLAEQFAGELEAGSGGWR